MQKFLAILLIVTGLLTTTVQAEIKTYSGTGRYVMSDFENRDIAKQRAQYRAERDAQKKAGVYVKNYSRSINFEMTDDEFSVVMNRITNIIDEVKYNMKTATADGEPVIIWTANLKAQIDTDGIYAWLKRDSQEKITIIKQDNDLRDKIQRNDELIEDLKNRYQHATTQAEKDALRQQMAQADKEFLAWMKSEEGSLLWEFEKYDAAINSLNEAVKLNPDYAEAYYYRGLTYKSLGQREQAFEDYNKAIELNPDFTEAYNNRGVIYGECGQPERALQDFDKAIELDPNNAEAYYNRGLIYDALKQYAKSIGNYDKAILLSPNDAKAYLNLGVDYFRLNQYEQAIQNFDKAIELKPDYAFAYNNRGLSYFELGQYKQAVENYDKAVELNPDYDLAYLNRGNAYYKMWKNAVRATKDYDKAIELNPNLVEAYAKRGLMHLYLKEFEEAISDFNKVLQFQPNFEEVYNNRGVAYLNLKQYERAIQDFQKALELDPNDALAKDNLELCYKALGK